MIFGMARVSDTRSRSKRAEMKPGSPPIFSFRTPLSSDSFMQHIYEGWRFSPFRNPLESSPPDQTLPFEECNNAWLGNVAYQTLCAFQVTST